MLLDGRLLPAQHVTVAVDDGALAFRVTAQVPSQPRPQQSGQEAAASQG